MANTVEFELVIPENLVFSSNVELVVVPGAEGDFGVLPGHAPFISSLRTGVISIYENDSVNERIFVTGGFAEVTSKRCTVLADEAIELSKVQRSDLILRVEEAKKVVNEASEDQLENTKSLLKQSEELLAVFDHIE
ncbi:MAG: ATP synthase F1 subunit epsilon [Rhodospirillales bacterium]|nr:ATP synthase F1 subunit epsilon [Rhodospirillales bacterium]|tara:strand:- start:1020 stop:1427 length:408 start_codon:yes stop_codon:yes gene_type:complete